MAPAEPKPTVHTRPSSKRASPSSPSRSWGKAEAEGIRATESTARAIFMGSLNGGRDGEEGGTDRFGGRSGQRSKGAGPEGRGEHLGGTLPDELFDEAEFPQLAQVPAQGARVDGEMLGEFTGGLPGAALHVLVEGAGVAVLQGRD